MPYILDTDHLSLLQKEGDGSRTLLARISKVPPDDMATTIVTFQEEVLGWLSELNRVKKADHIVRCYKRLDRVRLNFERMNVLPFDDAAQIVYGPLRRQCSTVGTLDLRIASIALVTGSILLTRNFRDFKQVPGLRFEDWTES